MVCRISASFTTRPVRELRFGTVRPSVPLDGDEYEVRALTVHVSPRSYPALVLNADFRPLSYYPLSLWSWQDAIKAVFMDRVNIVQSYDVEVRSSRFCMAIPSVVSLKTYVRPARNPAFTRFNVFLRDHFRCQY